MTRDYVFHIRNANPGDLAALLTVLESSNDHRTVTEIVSSAEEIGFVIRDRHRLEALATARDLGLVNQDKNTLTSIGRDIAILEHRKPDLFGDIIHGLQFSQWKAELPQANCFSWSYRTLCNFLWNAGSHSTIDRRDLASKVEAEARSSFDKNEIAFSSKSVGGALLWLAELEPPILDDKIDVFFRRAFCPPELFLMAVDSLYQSESLDYGANLLMNESRRDSISEYCFIEPENFDRVVDYTALQFDFFSKGVGGGWGQFFTLGRCPNFNDFCP